MFSFLSSTQVVLQNLLMCMVCFYSLYYIVVSLCIGLLRYTHKHTHTESDILMFTVGAHLHRLVSSPGFTRSTACWRHSTTQHNRHGRTPNTSVSTCGGFQPYTFHNFTVLECFSFMLLYPYSPPHLR